MLVRVAPDPGVVSVRFATTTDLANHLQAAPPVGARRLLRRAAARIDELLRVAVYPVDSNALPTEAAHIAAETSCEISEKPFEFAKLRATIDRRLGR